MKILLVGNYVPDGQHSMLGFSGLMTDGLRRVGHEVRTISPPVIFGQVGRYFPRALKWLAYIDKLLVFPPLLKAAERNADIVHICDHSNALYIPHDKLVPHVVTCHDLLAVRGSLGEQTDCPASSLGKWLQRWILRGLMRADTVACASTATLVDARRLLPGRSCFEVLPLALRYNLKPISESECARRLAEIRGLDSNVPFVFHVGSSQPRKNREGVLSVFAKVRERLNAQMVFAGKSLTTSQRKLAERLKIADQIVEAGEVSNELLAALYGRALTFFFPSRFEGFGWPIIEAQSCRCPVVCSDRGPFPEVAEDAALMRDVEDEQGFADDIVKLASDESFRLSIIKKGLQNVQRYSPEAMISRYVALYQRVLNSSRSGESAAIPITA